MKISILAIGELKPDFVSRCIQKKLGTDYSHSAILVDDVWLYHATGEGFHMQPLHTIMADHAIRHRIDFELAPLEAAFARGWIQGHIGQEYSQSQLLGFEFKWLRRFLANKNSKVVCSEAVGLFMFECLNIKDARLYACDWVTPKDVTEIAYAAKRD